MISGKPFIIHQGERELVRRIYVRGGAPVCPLINGGGQERRLRAWTENTAGIVGFGKAAEILLSRRKMDAIHLESMKRVFLDGLSGLEDYIINSPCDGVPGIISVSDTSGER